MTTQNYYQAITDAWRLMHKYLDTPASDGMYAALVKDSRDLVKKYDNSRFVFEITDAVMWEVGRVKQEAQDD